MAFEEFRGRKAIVFGAFLGMVGSETSLIFYSFGVFIAQFGPTFGTRGAMSIAISVHAAVLFAGCALVGRLADKYGSALIATVSMVLLGVSMMLIPFVMHDVKTMWLVYGIATLVGLGTTPVVLLKPVVASFSANRGLAIGLTMMGLGVGAIVIPSLTSALIELGGWRLGYRGLGAVAFIVAPVLWFTLKGSEVRQLAVRAMPEPASQPESIRQVLRSRPFWILTLIGIFITLGVSGFISHIVSYLYDLGVSPPEAAAIASLFGLSSMVGRLGCGVILDSIPRPFAGALFVIPGALGLLSLALYGSDFAVVGVILCGVVLGAEVDLLAYYTSRYFPIGQHGAVFGWNFSMISLATIFSPFLIGTLRDYQGTYFGGLIAMAAALGIAGLLCFALGPYRFDVRRAAATVA